MTFVGTHLVNSANHQEGPRGGRNRILTKQPCEQHKIPLRRLSVGHCARWWCGCYIRREEDDEQGLIWITILFSCPSQVHQTGSTHSWWGGITCSPDELPNALADQFAV